MEGLVFEVDLVDVLLPLVGAVFGRVVAVFDAGAVFDSLVAVAAGFTSVVLSAAVTVALGAALAVSVGVGAAATLAVGVSAAAVALACTGALVGSPLPPAAIPIAIPMPNNATAPTPAITNIFARPGLGAIS